MSENILLIIREKEVPKTKINPAIFLEDNQRFVENKPISPVVGKKIILKPKPEHTKPNMSVPRAVRNRDKMRLMRRRKMGMMFIN